MEVQTSVEIDAAERRFFKLQERTARNFGFGATDEAMAIAAAGIERLTDAIAAKVAAPVGKESKEAHLHRLLSCVSPDKLALIALNNAARAAMDDLLMVEVLANTGKMIHAELFAKDLEAHDKQLHARVQKWVTEKHGNLKYRLQAARALARRGGFSDRGQWKRSDYVKCGSILIGVLKATLPDLFTVTEDSEAKIVVTDGARKIAEAAMKHYVRLNPIFLPSLDAPEPWTAFNKGGPVDPIAQKLGTLVRTSHRETIAQVKVAIQSGQMQPALDALNAVQATPWKINLKLLNVMRECQRRGITVDGLPAAEDFPMPELERAWDDMDDAAKKLWRVTKEGIKRANRTLASDRLRYDEDMETASVLADSECFYIPHNLDWRGREYPMTAFNFQREDRVRALFLFADVETPIGDEGLAWLKVHVANCGDFEKVSKKSYDERVKWVDDNLDTIRHCAVKDWESSGPLDPKSLAFWTKADKPFLFLAACIELIDAISHGPTYCSALPVSWDGSCSGLQHLCAMTRAEEGAFVNLTDIPEPRDVYQAVADRALVSITAAAEAGDETAKLALAFGITRKVVKRNVMTYSYSSRKFGMAQQHIDDLMEPLKLEVMQGKRAAHPFGDEWVDHQNAARFLASHIHAAIEEIVKKPAQAMQFLQDLAKAAAHEGKPLEWTTPVGLPWSNRYHASKMRDVELWLHDRKLRIKTAEGYAKEIDKKRAANGVAPNFVHACDAAHLLLTVNAAMREGIRHLALVHDSFGCPPGHAARFQGIIRETFVGMYEEHDVLNEVLERASCDLMVANGQRLPVPVARGALNIKEVLDAKYAFA